MRRILLLASVLAFACGCGKKPAPPVVAEEAPGPEVPGAVEPSERDTLLATLKSKRGDSQREAADSLAALAETDEATRDALLDLLRDKTTDGAGKTHPTKIASIREAAAFSLMRAGPKGEAALTEKGLSALREGLTDKDPAVREHTVHTLGVLGPLAKSLSNQVLRVCSEDKDPQVRAIAFDALRSIGVADVPGLAALLNNKEPDVKRRAAEIISVLPEVPPFAVPSLARALEDEDELVREVAARAIGWAGTKGATKEAAERLADAVKKLFPPEFDPLKDQAPRILYIYFGALGQMGKEAVPATAGLLNHKVADVRGYAVRALGEIGPPAKSTAEAVKKSLTEPTADAALEAVVTLYRIGEEDLKDAKRLIELALASPQIGVAGAGVQTVARIGPAAKEFFPAALKYIASPEAYLRSTTLDLVESLDPAEAAKQVPQLAKLIEDPEAIIRWKACRVLSKLGPAAIPAADAIGKALIKESDEGVRDQFVDALVAMGSAAKPAVVGLAPLLSESTASVQLKIKVIGALAQADPASPESAKSLVIAANDRDQYVRKAAAAAIGKLDPLPDDARNVLVKMMKTDARAEVRAVAVRGLASAGPRAKGAKADLEAVANGTLPGPALWAKVALAAIDGDVSKAGAAVRAGLVGRNGSVRVAAAEALVVVGPTAADVPALVKLSREAIAGAKEAAARALGQLGSASKDAVPRLIELVADRDSDVKLAAIEALGRIGLPTAAPAIPKLKDAMRTDPSLATTTRKALDRLGVKDDGGKR